MMKKFFKKRGLNIFRFKKLKKRDFKMIEFLFIIKIFAQNHKKIQFRFCKSQ